MASLQRARRSPVRLALLLTLLMPSVARPAHSDPPQARVILFVWDGTQRNHLLELYGEGLLPNLRALVEDGGLLRSDLVIHSETCLPGSGDGYLTQTGPASSAIVTGYGYPDQGNQNNAEPNPIPGGYTFYERLEAAGAGAATGFLCNKSRDHWPTIPLSNAAPSIGYWFDGDVLPETLSQYAADFLTQYAGGSLFLYLHYGEPDTAGHAYGENSPEYSQAIVSDDAALGAVLDHLTLLGIREETRILVTTDHGFLEGGRNHYVCNDDDRNLWLATDQAVSISKPNVPAYQTSLTPTLLDLFGMDKNASPRFAGQSLYDDGKPTIPELYPIENARKESAYFVAWSAVPGADLYSVDESDSPDFAAPVSVYFGPGLEYWASGRPGGTWYYRVLALNSDGSSPWSNTESTEVWSRVYLPEVLGGR